MICPVYLLNTMILTVRIVIFLPLTPPGHINQVLLYFVKDKDFMRGWVLLFLNTLATKETVWRRTTRPLHYGTSCGIWRW
jgi:hypothetical protein